MAAANPPIPNPTTITFIPLDRGSATASGPRTNDTVMMKFNELEIFFGVELEGGFSNDLDV